MDPTPSPRFNSQGNPVMSRIHEALRRAQQEKGVSGTEKTMEALTGESRAPRVDSQANPPVMTHIHEALKRAEQKSTEIEKPTDALDGEGRANQKAEEAATPPVSVATLETPPQSAQMISEPPQFEELKRDPTNPLWSSDSRLLVFNTASPATPGAEQFRTLRSRLYRIRENQKLRSIVVSSALPAEGKTVVSANLAKVFAHQRGCRVLLMDCDLRSPALHKLLGAPQTPGIAEYLEGRKNQTDILQSDQQSGLCFIPAGHHTSHPSELISNGRLKKLLDRFYDAFDWIILDSPPTVPVADASVLAGMCDGVLLIVRAGSTPHEACQRARAELKDAHVLGVVLNGAEEGLGYGYNYPYYGKREDSLTLNELPIQD